MGRWTTCPNETAGIPRGFGKVNVLTPSTLRVLEAGYPPWVHPSVIGLDCNDRVRT
jgi:hypothetical protein